MTLRRFISLTALAVLGWLTGCGKAPEADKPKPAQTAKLATTAATATGITDATANSQEVWQ